MKAAFKFFSILRADAHTSQTNTTLSHPHVRDGININRVMERLVIALIPCMLVGIWNTGYQANSIMTGIELSQVPGLRGAILSLFNTGFDINSLWDNIIHGLAYFLPLLITTYLVTITWEQIFARAQSREASMGSLATAILFTLTLPPTVPLWQAAIGISFGVVIGREIFGGTGMNFINHVLAGRAFLYFAYPDPISTGSIWSAVDAYSGATSLGVAKANGITAVLASEVNWNMAFLGQVPGAIGETSTLACLAGAIILLFTRLVSWRIIVGSLAGLVLTAWLFNIFGSSTNPMFSMPWYWHLVLGGYAFGVIFLATDPVTSPDTQTAHWIYGFFIGLFVVIIRCTNPAIPEGVMFAILLANVFAPVLDHLVIQANIRRRLQYLRSSEKE